MEEYKGTYITVNCISHWYDHQAKMILEHYDTPEYDNTVFLLGAHVNPFEVYKTDYPTQKFIYYNMEQLYRNEIQIGWWYIDHMLMRIREAQQAGAILWDIDTLNEIFLNREGIGVDKVVPIRYAKVLEDLSPRQNEDIDVLFYGSLNTRRNEVLNTLTKPLYARRATTAIIVGGTLEGLKEYIERAKIVLNIHTSAPYNRQEQTRIAYLLNNKKCVLSEPSQINYFDDGIVESNNMAESILWLLEEDRYKEQAEKGYNILLNKSKVLL